MVKKAIILYGPSGVGKSTLAQIIASKTIYKHCNADYFGLAFSKIRSKERSLIAQKMGFLYAKELIGKKYSLIIEGVGDKHRNILKKILKKSNYKIIEISLVSPLEKCIKNNMTRKSTGFSKKVIKEVYGKYLVKKGIVIDVEKLTSNKIYEKIKRMKII